MKKTKKNFPGTPSNGLSKNHQDGNPDKRSPKPDEPFKETGTPVEKVPITSNPDHPHNEEILDGIPK